MPEEFTRPDQIDWDGETESWFIKTTGDLFTGSILGKGAGKFTSISRYNHGLQEWTNEKGALCHSINYWRGKKHGSEQEFWFNGNLKTERYWLRGQLMATRHFSSFGEEI